MTKVTEGAAAAADGRVTEEDLLKSLTDLETKKPAEGEVKTDPVVEVAPLEKTAKDAIAETASEELKKALDVSSVLREVVSLLGGHQDVSLGALQKSIQAGAERDLAVIRVLGDLKKSIDENTAAIKAFGQEPGKPAAAAAITVTTTDVLEKSVKEAPAGKPAEQAAAVRRKVLVGLETLAKSASDAGDNAAAMSISHATAKFESAGEISDQLLAKAVAAADQKLAKALV